MLHPQADQFLLVPIVPHLSLPYPLVLPPEACLKLSVGNMHRAILSIDGHISLPMEGGSGVTVKKSRAKTRFLRLGAGNSFYSSLEQKLRG